MTDPVLDRAVIESLRQLNQPGEPDVVQQVLTLFLADAQLRLADVSDAIDRADPAALERAAHTFKGAAASIGASRLQRCCRELETLGKDGTVTGAARLFDALREEFERVKVDACDMIKPC